MILRDLIHMHDANAYYIRDRGSGSGYDPSGEMVDYDEAHGEIELVEQSPGVWVSDWLRLDGAHETYEYQIGFSDDNPWAAIGRPPLYGERMAPISVSLTSSQIAWLDAQPDQSRSATIRRLIEEQINPPE